VSTIRNIWQQLRDRGRREDGFTLVELAVTTIVMAVAGTIFVTALSSIQTAVNREGYRSRTNDQIRLAVEQMDREIRSGNLVYDPAADVYSSPACGGYACVAGYSLRVYTQSNGNTRSPANQCVQWLITPSTHQFLRRAWASGGGASLGGWRIVADGIVNADPAVLTPAFALDGNSRTVAITLLSNAKFGATNAPPTTRLQSSIAIRNSATGNPCTPIPST
jgi:type II secretory pathway pseudopilin PulG